MVIVTDDCKMIGRHNFLVQKLEAKIVSMVCIVMCTASLRPVTILPQIFTVWCTKLPKHFNAIIKVLYCFTVAIALLGDASDYHKDKSCSAHAKQGGCRVRQQ